MQLRGNLFVDQRYAQTWNIFESVQNICLLQLWKHPRLATVKET